MDDFVMIWALMAFVLVVGVPLLGTVR